jgi:hypothetical protein
MNFKVGDKVKVFGIWDGEVTEAFDGISQVRHTYHVDFKDVILEQCYGNEVLTLATTEPVSEVDATQEVKSKK